MSFGALIQALVCLCLTLFFSSRRRHTRFDCDWSSDVCSSDLRTDSLNRRKIGAATFVALAVGIAFGVGGVPTQQAKLTAPDGADNDEFGGSVARSEERRVGKEGRSRWSPYH